MATEAQPQGFREQLDQFISWLFAEAGITDRPGRWFEDTIGLDKKYLTRWLSGTLPSEDNWPQFKRKVEGKYQCIEGLKEHLERLALLLSSARKKQAARPQRSWVGSKSTASGVQQYFSDFVDIVEPWQQFCRDSTRLDLVVMYASTWRNTYLKYVREMLEKPGSRLRAVLPPADGDLLKTYSTRLATPVSVLAGRIRDAWSEFQALGETAHVQLYATTYYMNHALYLFDTGGVVAFYSYRTDRCATPALLMGSGDLLEFARKDFDWLVSKENRATELKYQSRGRRH